MEKAETELGENVENRNDKLRELEDRIERDKDIPVAARHDHSFLLRFLRAKKFDIDKSFKMVNCDVVFFFSHHGHL